MKLGTTVLIPVAAVVARALVAGGVRLAVELALFSRPLHDRWASPGIDPLG